MVAWRACLADGRTVTYDGHNTPQPVLDGSVRVEGTHAARVVTFVEPLPHQRVVFRWDRGLRGGQQFQVGFKLGLADRATGTALVCEYSDGPMRVTSDVVLTPEEAS